MECFDPESLPTGPLSMSTLVSLEPQGLRRILKSGLRQGIGDGQLKQLIREAFCEVNTDQQETQILRILETRGWLTCENGRWKTRLG